MIVAEKGQGHDLGRTPGTVTTAPVPGVRPRQTTLELGSLPSAIACARGHAANVMSEWGLGHLADDAVLLVSELMTNALDASAVMLQPPPIMLRLVATDTSIVIEAWDQSPLDLEPIDADDDAECGRGLAVVQALSKRWGHRRVGYNSKVVWAELDVPPLPLTEAGLPLRHRVRRTLDHARNVIDDPELLRRVHRGLTQL